jgi:hypothetical protein
MGGRNAYKNLGRNLSGDLGVDGIVLKLVLRQCGVRMCTGSNWLCIGYKGGLSVSIKPGNVLTTRVGLTVDISSNILHHVALVKSIKYRMLTKCF